MEVLRNLLDEHKTIVMVVGLLNGSVKKLQSRAELPPEFLERILNVLREYVNACHHTKEEVSLFPLVKVRGTEDAGMVSVLLEEHEKGRSFVRAMGEAVNEQDTAGIIKNANDYASLLLQHIKKENLIFPKWMAMLTDETKNEMSERFEQIEESTIGSGKQQQYLQTVEKMKKELMA